ncbi:MAG: hypothetical protein IPK39_09085, partial [Sulfuritalea sp.]|nr:hypothetical protein [Sulfuritalea sp.]
MNTPSEAWPQFARKLSAALRKLEEDQFLIPSIKHSDQYIQFAAQGSFGIRAETTSNSYLPESRQLTEQQIAGLIDVGWHPPSGSPADATPEKSPDGSPNYFIDFLVRKSFKAVASAAVRTFADILHVPHPGYLEYELFDADGNAFALPELGLKHATRSLPDEQASALPQRLLATMTELTGIDDLEFDKDGDIGIRYRAVSVFVRLVGALPHVHIFSPMLTDVEETAQLLARLNEINAGTSHLHLFVRNGAIVAVADVPAEPFVTEYVTRALQDFCPMIEDIGSLL